MSSDPLIGRRLDGRYQIRSRIARGGMATVYLASDERLDRPVAIKVMHGHLADDEGYRERFIQEARSAARLAHPNVVNVFDQGQDDETAYLVMEYLPGITLRDLLNDHRQLTVEQAFDVLEAILSGLAAAHRSGLVHRDLKPENVLLADDGRIKISDFGLARAATANTATGTALMGTIAYLSPELVTRGVADTRSDIYAVGIMLYEMLTGEQPFKGEQVFQIAHQHVTETVPPPSDTVPGIPAELDELVRWATSREPEDRPEDAGTMLTHALQAQRSIAGGASHTQPLARTMVMPMALDTTAETQVIAPAAPPTHTAELDRDESSPVDALATHSARRGRRTLWLLLIVLLLTGAAAGTGWYFGFGPGAMTAVPDVSGHTVEDARLTLEAAGFEVAEALLTETHPTVPVDAVIGTTPPAGDRVRTSSPVSIIVSLGPAPLAIPALAGLPEAQAVSAVEAAPFTLEEVRYLFTPDVAAGAVVQAVTPDGTDLSTLESYGELQPVSLVVSRGPIPDVAGTSLDDAIATLSEVNLTGIESIEEYHDTIPAGAVIRAQPSDGAATVPEGGTVELIISKGIEQVVVPNVAGKPWTQAKEELLAAGFTLAYNTAADSAPAVAVVSHTVPGGDGETTADKGSRISVVFYFIGGP